MVCPYVPNRRKDVRTAEKLLIMLSFVLTVPSLQSSFAKDSSLILQYDFDSAAGTNAVDKSGNDHTGEIIGQCKWSSDEAKKGLLFNGTGNYINCGNNYNVSDAGTIAVWFYPNALQGGLVSWSTGTGWNDYRLTLACNNNSFFCCIANGKDCRILYDTDPFETEKWHCLVFTFDGKIINYYRNGALKVPAPQKETLKPNISNIPMYIGKCTGIGKEYFDGIISEVKVYNRALTSEEVLDSYRKGAKKRKLNIKTVCILDAKAYPGPGKIFAKLDIRLLEPLPSGVKLTSCLTKPESKNTIQCGNITKIPVYCDIGYVAVFDVQRLDAGDYTVHAGLLDENGKITCESKKNVNWTGQPKEFENVNVLNNLVFELLNIDAGDKKDINDKYVFTNPWKRWVFIRTESEIKDKGELYILIDTEQVESAVITCDNKTQNTEEAMRYLDGGKHTLKIIKKGDVSIRKIIIRSIPMLHYAYYDAHPYVAPFGPYDWNFLSRHILPNVNTILSCFGDDSQAPGLEKWRKSGRHWFSTIQRPRNPAVDESGVKQVFDKFTKPLQNPLRDGVIIDEFGESSELIYDVYTKAVLSISSNALFPKKVLAAYSTGLYGAKQSRDFGEALVKGNGYIARENYLPERMIEHSAVEGIGVNIQDINAWEKSIPGVTRNLIWVYGLMNIPPESCNIDPTSDFRAYMDMQTQGLAVLPEFFGLGGIQWYHSSYSDEENLRLVGKLFRNYALEGHIEQFINDPYKLTHIMNPDFKNGVEHWDIAPAKENSIEPKSFAGYGCLQGRWRNNKEGDTFLVTKRSGKKPNMFSQKIKNLKPGKLYSLKMITGDYQDLIQGSTNKIMHSANVKIKNAEILTDAKDSFQYPVSTIHSVKNFSGGNHFWINYHWRVFRAKGATAALTVSDWKDDENPGGPVGQELMFNFIELQPFLENTVK